MTEAKSRLCLYMYEQLLAVRCSIQQHTLLSVAVELHGGTRVHKQVSEVFQLQLVNALL